MSNHNLTKPKALITGAVLLAAFLPALVRADYPSTVLSQNPIGYYRFSETAPIPPAGGDQPHNNLQPYLTFNFNIALQGVFPPRT